MLHPEAAKRDQLLNILFNLIKKPDVDQRSADVFITYFVFHLKLFSV